VAGTVAAPGGSPGGGTGGGGGGELVAVPPEVPQVVLQQVAGPVALHLLVHLGDLVDQVDSAVGPPAQTVHHLNPMDLVAVGVPVPLAFWGGFALVGFLGLFPLVGTAGEVAATLGRTWLAETVPETG
jgi:hypothetical protein